MAQDLHAFLRLSVLPLLSSQSGQCAFIQSPYAGGVLSRYAAALADRDASKPQPFNIDSLKLGTLNPGRTAVAILGTNDVIQWRLWAVALKLVDLKIDICVVPGHRLPHGTSLPEGFPFVFYGLQGVGWDSVGIFVSTELDDLVFEIEKFGGGRIMWIGVRACSSLLILGAFYAKPGGDVDLWKQILDDYHACSSIQLHAFVC